MGELNHAIIGKAYPTLTHKVEADATKRYALATNEDNPFYLDDTCGGGIVAPPLFAIVPAFGFLTAALGDPDLQLPLDRSLHGEQDMYFDSPLRPGDILITEGRISGMNERSSGETLHIEVVSKTEGGEQRVRQFITMFISDPARKKSARAPDEDLGAPMKEAAVKVSQDQSYRYADASGDHNLPHINEEFARSIGYKGVFLQGMCTMAFTSKAAIEELAAGDPARLKRLKVRFSRVVFPGDVLTTSFWSTGEGSYAFETRNQDHEAVIKEGIAEIEGVM